MFGKCRSKPTPPPSTKVMLSPQRADFEVVFKSRVGRNSMINKASAGDEHVDLIQRLRFCAAADEYADTLSNKEKRQKARKIVCMFIQNGSIFQLTDMPTEMMNGLLNEKFEYIGLLREHFAELLSMDPFVISAVSQTSV
ncbi:hypothetical protein BASA81_007780 [Batrachochytrium salamandrivorans]|nr:hypothetical protein BASA81_007780 [Batrachochytrium salamandrivorans]